MEHLIIIIVLSFAIIGSFSIWLLFRGKKNLINNTIDSVIVVQVNVFEHLTNKLSDENNYRTAKLIAGSIINIIFKNSAKSKEQQDFVDKNLNLIESKIRALKNNRKVCEALRQAIIISVTTPKVSPKGKSIATIELAKKLNDALFPFIKYGLFKKDKLFNKPINPILFIAMAKKLSFD